MLSPNPGRAWITRKALADLVTSLIPKEGLGKLCLPPNNPLVSCQ